MLFRGDVLLFQCQLLEGADHTETCVPRFDDIIDIALLSGLVRVGEEIVVFFLLLFKDFGCMLRIR